MPDLKTKIFVGVSAVLNAVLLSFLFGLVPFLLYLSVVVNILLVWYCFRLFRSTDDLQRDTLNIFENLESYADHLEKIHGMEMFYGEPVLQDLINHSKNLINDLVDLQEEYFEYETIEEEYDTDEETSEEEE
tara:strand:+ start:103 stop:498 length:396 start_codon:yes stop_codon:yes gene_type:complete